MMLNEISGVKACDVKFIHKLKQSDHSSVFQVLVREKACVMKVVSWLQKPRG
jgi:hypothetical protein